MAKAGSILLGLALVMVTGLQAQDQRIGFINSDRILEQMPEYEGIEQQLQLLSDTWYAELEHLESERERLEQEFEAREILFTDEMRVQHQNEITALSRSEEHTLNSSHVAISYAVFCLKKKTR